MSEPIISIEGLSKCYIIGHQREKGDGLRHVLERSIRAPLQWFRPARPDRGGASGLPQPGAAGKGLSRFGSTYTEEFWALRDLNLKIEAGEVLGIIGRNGAGKSTLLKILSRITEPTAGRICLRGRVASLLEVGTGFHPELTGRENIFLNGAILGMARTEIKRKFDEIVAFANIDQFIDTPVKRYSSGMYVRLAFAVAAHLEPEILIVDEVLAVGDAEFQKKCLEKMDAVSTTGRTVLFVSHNMQAVTRLVKRCVLLEKGQIVMDGPAQQVAAAYLNTKTGISSLREWPVLDEAPGDPVVRLRAVRVKDRSGALADTFDIRHPIGVEIEYDVLQPGFIFHPHFGVRNEDGVMLFVAQDVDPAWRGRRRPTGRYRSLGWIPGNLLAEGVMSVHTTLMTLQPEEAHCRILDVVVFRVIDCLEASDTSRGDYPRPIPGVMRPMLQWTTEYEPAGGEPGAVSGR